MANNSEILGEWADQGYFLKEYWEQITVNYKDDGSREIAAFDRGVITPEAAQLVCKRHNATLLAEEVVN